MDESFGRGGGGIKRAKKRGPKKMDLFNEENL